MLAALFNLDRNTQESKWTIFFECQRKVFLSIEKILEKINQDNPKCTALLLFSTSLR